VRGFGRLGEGGGGGGFRVVVAIAIAITIVIAIGLAVAVAVGLGLVPAGPAVLRGSAEPVVDVGGVGARSHERGCRRGRERLRA
ncbi:hypothetical protein HLK59_14235, partial [Streptomyces sp. S3(2020)]|uniref:hypothetical protein n=1 Tax=Streptomyces sp. S3(2020) TaxID=2732044 RepID=UPI00179DC1F0